MVGKGKAALLWGIKSVGGWIRFQKSHQKPREQMETLRHSPGAGAGRRSASQALTPSRRTSQLLVNN